MAGLLDFSAMNPFALEQFMLQQQPFAQQAQPAQPGMMVDPVTGRTFTADQIAQQKNVSSVGLMNGTPAQRAAEANGISTGSHGAQEVAGSSGGWLSGLFSGKLPQQQGGLLNRMGDALITMGNPFADPSAMTDPRQRQQAIGMALMNMGTGIHQARTRNPLAAIGQGVQYAGQQGMQTAEGQMRNELFKQQIEDKKRDSTAKTATQRYLMERGKPAWFAGTDADWQTYAMANPGEAFKAIVTPPDAKAYSINPITGETIVNPVILNAELAKRAAGRSSVVNNIDMKGEGEFSKVAGKLDAERFNEYVVAANSAREFRGNLGALADLSRSFQTGKVAEFKAAVGPYLQAIGIDVKDLGAIQSFEGIVDRMAPAMRVPGSGATSDFEMKKFLSALPQLGRTPEGNAIVTQVLDAIMAHRQQAGAIATQALTGKISRQEANKRIGELGDPLAAWRQAQASGIATGAGGGITGYQPPSVPFAPGQNRLRPYNQNQPVSAPAVTNDPLGLFK